MRICKLLWVFSFLCHSSKQKPRNIVTSSASLLFSILSSFLNTDFLWLSKLWPLALVRYTFVASYLTASSQPISSHSKPRMLLRPSTHWRITNVEILCICLDSFDCIVRIVALGMQLGAVNVYWNLYTLWLAVWHSRKRLICRFNILGSDPA